MNTHNPLIIKTNSPTRALPAPIVWFVLALFAQALLAGCASLPLPGADGPGGSSLAIPPPKGFVAQGKLSLRPVVQEGAEKTSAASASQDDKNTNQIKGFTANFRWQQVEDRYDLELWGALGQGRTRITGTANRIKIVDGSGRVVKSRNPERLLRRHLGWSLPLSVLPYWLQGKAAPSPPARLMRFRPNADLSTMEQLAWELEFSRYAEVTSTTRRERLPGRIKATNSRLKLTIIPRDWELSAPEPKKGG